MPAYIRIYFDFLSNIFSFLFFLEMLTEHKIISREKRHKYLPLLLFVQFAYSIPTRVPFSFTIGIIIDIISLLILSDCSIKKKQGILLKYELLYPLLCCFIMVMHSIILHDYSFDYSGTYYAHYKSVLICALAYIGYVLYRNAKLIKKLNSSFYYQFTILIIIVCLLSSNLTLYICKMEYTNSFLIPVLFSGIFVLISVVLSLYRQFIQLLSRQLQTEVQLQTYKQKQQYDTQIEENLKLIRSIRHDIKNHLLIIDGYASQNQPEKVHEYIQKISDIAVSTQLIDTPCPNVSALLNAKVNEASLKEIKCDVSCNFPYIHIGDYTITTILGNLLDNAILAASKVEHGWITLDISQLDSCLAITISNNHMEEIKEKDGVFSSTKESTATIFHGIGLANARSAASSINGTVEITYDEHTFRVAILLPNY